VPRNGYDGLFRLDGKVAVVTGASQNIGAAIARLFAHAGCDLVITARRLGPLQLVADDIRENSGVRVLALASDITLRTDRDELIRQSLATFDHVDVLVNNAYAANNAHVDDAFSGTSSQAVGILEQPASLWEAGFQGNILGPCELVRGFAPGMLAALSGSVINVVSTAAFKLVHGQGVYGTTKAAMETMTRYLAQDLAPIIRVNALCPGTVLEVGAPVSERVMHMLDSIPLARFGVADECAACALYLASDASSYTTGQTIFVDGGKVNVGTAGRRPKRVP
jgi:NAD(P)-dependent dehydrogenase (short-subunit alcohol dehydrogenase family)